MNSTVEECRNKRDEIYMTLQSFPGLDLDSEQLHDIIELCQDAGDLLGGRGGIHPRKSNAILDQAARILFQGMLPKINEVLAMVRQDEEWIMTSGLGDQKLDLFQNSVETLYEQRVAHVHREPIRPSRIERSVIDILQIRKDSSEVSPKEAFEAKAEKLLRSLKPSSATQSHIAGAEMVLA